MADVFGVRLSGLLAWILWRTVYLSKFPGLDRKARILADWTMDMFLPRDITQVRIFRHPQVHREHFEPGEEVFRQGDIGDRIYFVIDGEGDVEIDGRVADSVGPGSVFGEIALMNEPATDGHDSRPHAMNLASVEREAFHTLVAHFPGVRAAMDEILAAHTAMPASRTSQSTPSCCRRVPLLAAEEGLLLFDTTLLASHARNSLNGEQCGTTTAH